jgi:hypothetical protein
MSQLLTTFRSVVGTAVGDVSQAASVNAEQPTSESGGFNVEMAGETAATNDDSTASPDRWEPDSTDRDG